MYLSHQAINILQSIHYINTNYWRQTLQITFEVILFEQLVHLRNLQSDDQYSVLEKSTSVTLGVSKPYLLTMSWKRESFYCNAHASCTCTTLNNYLSQHLNPDTLHGWSTQISLTDTQYQRLPSSKNNQHQPGQQHWVTQSDSKISLAPATPTWKSRWHYLWVTVWGQRLIGFMLLTLYCCFLLRVLLLSLSQRSRNEQAWSSPEQRNCCCKWLLWEDGKHWRWREEHEAESWLHWVISFPCPIFCFWLCVENSPISLTISTTFLLLYMVLPLKMLPIVSFTSIPSSR